MEFIASLILIVFGSVFGAILADRWKPRTIDPMWRLVTAINNFDADVTIHPVDQSGKCAITVRKRSICETFTAATYTVALAQALHWCGNKEI